LLPPDVIFCTKFDFSWGSAPDLTGTAYSAPPEPIAVFKGPTSKGKEEEWRGKGEGREGAIPLLAPSQFFRHP